MGKGDSEEGDASRGSTLLRVDTLLRRAGGRRMSVMATVCPACPQPWGGEAANMRAYGQPIRERRSVNRSDKVSRTNVDEQR